MKISERYVTTRSECSNTLVTSDREYKTSAKLVRTGELDPYDRFWQSYLRGNSLSFPEEQSRRIVIGDVFSSVGGLSMGLDLGLRSLDFTTKHAFCVDLDGDALSVFSKNLSPSKLLNCSASDTVDFYVQGEALSARFVDAPTVNHPEMERFAGRVNVLCGGPPCQGHSNLNNRTRRDDVRNLLYLTMPALASALRVEAVVIENVPSVVNDSWGVVATSKGLLQDAGYQVFDAKLMLSDYGGFQTRERYFLLGFKNPRHDTPIVEFLKPFRRAARPVRIAIDDLLMKSTTDMWGRDLFDSVGIMSAENQDRISYLFDNNLYNLPLSERPDCHKDGTSYGSVYGRMYWDEPSPTITTGFVTPGRGRFIHPVEPRVLTAHEAARIQSFPDSFDFNLPDPTKNNRTLFAKWIGDAVPPMMSRLIGIYTGSQLADI